MEERRDYQNNVPYEGQNPAEMGNGQQGMYGPGSSGEGGAPVEREEEKPKWVIGRTVLGILSIVLFILVAMSIITVINKWLQALIITLLPSQKHH